MFTKATGDLVRRETLTESDRKAAEEFFNGEGMPFQVGEVCGGLERCRVQEEGIGLPTAARSFAFFTSSCFLFWASSTSMELSSVSAVLWHWLQVVVGTHRVR
jgi:hypothetical protein